MHMNPPPTALQFNKWDMGPNRNSSNQRIPDERFGWWMKGCPKKERVFLVSPKSFPDLLQNCDLPPPLNVFAGESEMVVRTTRMQQTLFTIRNDKMEDDLAQGLGEDKMGLLKALRLSQTRAREAEKKASVMSEEKAQLMALFLQQSSHLFAHRQWLRLLEAEVAQQHSQLAFSHASRKHRSVALKKDDGADTSSTWYIALTLCLGIAGMGLALACRYLF